MQFLDKKKVGVLLALILLFFALTPLVKFSRQRIAEYQFLQSYNPTPIPTQEPIGGKPLPKKERYDIYLLGDSMTHALGPRGGVFTELLRKEYPGMFFEVSNYAKSTQNILSLPEKLGQPFQADKDLLLKPVLEGNPDIIIIESFGYNPLSHLGIKGGLKKQNETLDKVVGKLKEKFPNAVIIFLATIAPDKKTYGQSINPVTTDNERWAQAEERIEYITNHIAYAQEHRIPLANAYIRSLDKFGDGDLIYINQDDDIHPSGEGLALMGRVLVETIVKENIFPR
jgi:lysophospholipase L1-like esterase